ncbi:MAG: 3-oxoacyl-[acyl-carrier-protein] reductase [Spirochaetia bacterium]|nr:3-oxoacyl-[acyl-carrier-protein] reductase [Spirochaetia bacterium]
MINKYDFSDIKGQVVLVTGSGQGIGRSIAEKFAAHGANIVISDVNPETANKTATEIAQYGVETLAIACDVSKKEQVENMFQKILDKWGKLDTLVNNAGITMDGLFIRMKEEQWLKVLEVNLFGVFLCSQAASNIMRKVRKGSIISISSIAARGNPGQSNYSASKAGVIGLSNTLARELAPLGIRSNCIAPGFIKTPMTDKIPEKHRERMLSAIPLARAGEPDDVANAALFLASELSSYITGHVLDVNGGISGL